MADARSQTTTVHALANANANATSAAAQVATVIDWLTFSVGLPVIAMAIYVLKNVSSGGNKIPIHVIFLLVSDIISFLGRPRVDQDVDQDVDSGTVVSSSSTDFIFYFGVISNITLMSFIAQKLHVSVVYPQCLGCCASVRRSPVVALAAWAVPLSVLALAVLEYDFWFAVALLVPFPFLLFFTVDSWRALTCSTSNRPTPARRRTVLAIGAIWANYTVLYGPFILSVLLRALSFKDAVRYLELVSHLLLYLSPLVDPFIYIFMTKGFKEVLQALPCCQRPDQQEDTRTTVNTVAETVDTVDTVAETRF
ncbi:hypothetical protein JOB18_011857 [Solea senegalensis]|uniref:G-protein coupled receptors family 1 profile domain-containing protein n=1 Tax=Solea senegalensis TaxID=28829 RepID=A0AAV6PJS3_SOLSE|nr:uncharacterized protein LOC122763758 [Solea senegalensis]KAG7463324.1 hypothetical protein JOB18_011857 [Solea senegalensis]